MTIDILLRSLRVSVLAGAGVALTLTAGCGGGAAESGAPPKVAPRPKPKGPSAKEQMAKADKLFDELSKRIDKLDYDADIDPKWLKGELDKVIELDPGHSAARFNLAVLMERDGKREEARKVYEAIAGQDPKFAPASENLAAVYVSQGDKPRASAIYKRMIKADPKNVTSRLGLARLLVEERQYKQAIDLCRKALERKADAIEAFRVLAKAYKATNNIPMAQLIIGRGLKVDEKDVELHYMLSQILLEQGELGAGVDKLKEIVAMKPGWLKIRAQLADIAMQYRDYGSASQQYEAILKEDKNNLNAKVALAVAYKGLGRFKEASQVNAEVLKKSADNLDAIWNSAVLNHHHLNQFDRAIAFYQLYRKSAPPGDKKAAQVDGLIKEVNKIKSDTAARKAREERERKKRDAIIAACDAVEAGKKAQTADIGNESEVLEVAWGLMVDAQGMIQSGDLAGGERSVNCAFGILPNTPQANTSACAPMHVMWTQILYQLGRMDEALADIRAGLKCDPENPDAQLIEQQLIEIMAAEQAGGAEGTAPAKGSPAGDPGAGGAGGGGAPPPK